MVIEKEVRHMQVGKLEVRAIGGKAKTLVGYASVFNTLSEDMGFFETVAPGAFARALREKQDVRCLVNHDASKIIGRTKSGTLRLFEDAVGLKMECDCSDTSYGRDMLESVSRGDIDQMSFSFGCLNDSWSEKNGKSYRTLLDVDLFDVSPVTFPAYSDTSISARALARASGKGASTPNRCAARLRLARARL